MHKLLRLIIIAGVIMWLMVAHNNHQTLQYSTQNLVALQDSVKKFKDINAYMKSIYAIRESELEKLLNISKEENNSLKNELKSKINYISKLESAISVDSIRVDSIYVIKGDTNITANFNYNDNWLKFGGGFKLSHTPPNYNIYNFSIKDIELPLPLTIGLTSDKKMFIKTDNPYLNITNIIGADIIENQIKHKVTPRWTHGIGVGVGFQYGIINKKVDFGPGLSYSIVYNF